ncbi:MAG: DUF881 domain-containing protein [Aeromicrobium sp.]|nr:MAG: DUF881 domain-containing protein [Aeromicrobium sp.]
MTQPPQKPRASAVYAGPGREAESLLEQLADSAMDNAYYDVDRESEPSPASRTFTFLAILLLGFSITVVTVQSRNDRPATELERQALIDNIQARREILDSRQTRLEALQVEVQSLSNGAVTPTRATARDELNAGAVAVDGDGIVIELRSAPGNSGDGVISDLDVQLVVNGLWMSGAEAIDVGGNRLTATSAIRAAGEGITVNFNSIPEPIVIQAIGSQSSLERQFRVSPSGRYLENRSQMSGIRWTIERRDNVQLPAAPAKRLKIRHASPQKRGGS